MKDIHDQTFYELLEVEQNASQEEILKAYNRARATYGHNSPALYSLFNKEEAQALLRLIDEAYAVLSNQFKRKQYDSKTFGGPTGPQSNMPSASSGPAPDRGSSAIPEANGDFAIPSAGDIAIFDDKEMSAPPREFDFKNANVTRSSTDRVDYQKMHAQHSAPMQQQTYAPAPTHQPQSSPSTSHGMGKTPFSTYKIDPAFEEEIKNIQDFTGPVLEKIRVYKNVTLEHIAETTKINRPYLMAIEKNNFSSLPAPVFVRGFLVQLAKILGLDAKKVPDSFLKIYKEATEK